MSNEPNEITDFINKLKSLDEETLRKLRDEPAESEHEAIKSDARIITDDEPEATDTEPKKHFLDKNKNIALVATVGLVLSIGLAFLVQLVIVPWFELKGANNELTITQNQSGQLQAINTKLTTFTGSKAADVNVAQKALSTDGKTATNPAGFIWDNNKPGKKKNLDVYLDFSEQHSRDFLLINADTIKNAIEAGSLRLMIHPVPTGKAYSMYAAEALAESFYTTPDNSWDFMINLLKAGQTFSSNKSVDWVNLIVETAKKSNVKGVDAASIKNGTFSSWIISVGNASQLQTGYYPPLVYVDNNLIDSSKVTLTDPDAFRKALLG